MCCVHRPVFEAFGDEPHGCRSYVLRKETFEGAELSLADDVVEGRQSLSRGPVHVWGDEVHKPVVCPFTPFYFLSEKTHKYKHTHTNIKHTHTNINHEYPALYVLNDHPISSRLLVTSWPLHDIVHTFRKISGEKKKKRKKCKDSEKDNVLNTHRERERINLKTFQKKFKFALIK